LATEPAEIKVSVETAWLEVIHRIKQRLSLGRTELPGTGGDYVRLSRLTEDNACCAREDVRDQLTWAGCLSSGRGVGGNSHDQDKGAQR
jgi:hypothetical protein